MPVMVIKCVWQLQCLAIRGKRAGQSNGDSRNEVRAASPVATATAATVFWESGPMMSPLLAQSTDGLRQVLNKRFANTHGRTH